MAASLSEVPFQVNRIQAYPVCGVGGLKNEISRHRIDRIFESAVQEAWAVRVRQHPSVAQAGIPNTGVAATAGYRVATRGPDLHFGGALLWARLCKCQSVRSD